VHSSLISHDNKTLFVADLGTDKIMVYDFDAATGNLKPAPHPWISCVAGAGPRHMALHPELNILYVAEELSSSVSVFNTGMIREDGASALQRVPTLPPDFAKTNSVADIHVSPDGKHVYVSNRGHNSIAIFRTDPSDGSLTEAVHQPTLGIRPRSFSLSSDGNLLLVANRNTDNITVFRRNPASGMLEETGMEIFMADPNCIKHY
ncbi:MAG: lactonase family protein, partial [Bacteroidales bacterium]|nr:lactonase family protein [Bacteroidales bacterium]